MQFRERALGGRWVSRGIKFAVTAIAAGLAMVLWGAYRQPEPFTIGFAGFLSGVVVTLFYAMFAARQRYRAAWPFTEMVTDWDKVRELAGQPVKPPGQTSNATSESD